MTGLEMLCLSSRLLNECGYIAPDVSIGNDYTLLRGYREDKGQKVTVHIEETTLLISADKDKSFDPLNLLKHDWQKHLKNPTEKEIEDAIYSACYLRE